ncbi:MAG: hypothetical protein AVDCRST_MAG90-1190, partial [uncultured Microvirga sp.]
EDRGKHGRGKRRRDACEGGDGRDGGCDRRVGARLRRYAVVEPRDGRNPSPDHCGAPRRGAAGREGGQHGRKRDRPQAEQGRPRRSGRVRPICDGHLARDRLRADPRPAADARRRPRRGLWGHHVRRTGPAAQHRDRPERQTGRLPLDRACPRDRRADGVRRRGRARAGFSRRRRGAAWQGRGHVFAPRGL